MDQAERLATARRVTLVGFSCNLAFAVIKIATGYIGHSYALVADGVESAADLAGSLVVWRGVVIAHKPPDSNHPYGHGRAETLAAGFISVLLLATAVWIVIQAASSISGEHPKPEAYTLWVLLGVILIKEILFRFVVRAGKKIDSQALLADAGHHRSDAITSFAAAAGITIALVGGPGYEKADACAALVAGGVIAYNALRLVQPVVSELMEEAPPPDFILQVKQTALEVAGVQDVEKCFARRIGHGMVIELHIEVEPAMNVQNAHFLSHKVKDLLRSRFPKIENVVVHIEPHQMREN
jgi:cation diffusion facilitator family transporter